MRKMIIVLTGITILAGLVLGTAYTVFNPKIVENQKAALNRSLAAIFEGAGNPSFEQVHSQEPIVYKAYTENGEELGWVAELSTTGYGGEIRMLVGLNPEASEIAGIEIVENVETPGLGGRITEDWFTEQFEGLKPGTEVDYIKNEEPEKEENEIQAISGATISTKAVVGGINSKLPEVLDIISQSD